MDQKLVVTFEVKKNDRAYTFCVPAGAPLGEAYDCLHELLMKITELAKESAEKTKPVEENAVEPEVVQEA